jgi:hypothetical protein
MRKPARLIGQLLLGGTTLLALGFGTSQAVSGQSDLGEDCQPCRSTPECQACCITELNFDDGICFAPNCICF